MQGLIGLEGTCGGVSAAFHQVQRTDDAATQIGQGTQLGWKQTPALGTVVGDPRGVQQHRAAPDRRPAANLDGLDASQQQSCPRLLD